MKPAVHDGITFGPFRISPSERMLRRGETVIPLPPKVVETLLALAEQPGRVVDKKDLLERVWPNTFVEEGGLARNISVLRRTLGVTADGKPYIETVPRRGYRFVVSVTESKPADEEEACSLGVLPLRNLSADATDESFADGMTDALINYFLRIDGLRVASRTSSMRFKRSPKSLREIAFELGAELVVEGSVLLAGDRVRIAVSLIRAQNEHPMWGGEYERQLADVLALQGEVAREIVQQIRGKLPAREPEVFREARAVHPEAYQEYLRGRYFWNQRTRESLQQALECFRRAIALDPEDAAAYAGLAESYALLGSVGYDGMPPHAAMPAAREAALKALELDSRSADARAALGIVKLLYDWDLPGAESELHTATALNPACLAAHQWLGELQLARARPEAAAVAFSRGAALDPYSIPCKLGLGWAYYFSRRYPEAAARFGETLEISPRLPMALYGLGLSLHHQGQSMEALATLRRAESDSGGEPASVTLLAVTAILTGNLDGAAEQLARLREMAPHTYVPPVYFAFIHAMRNELDDAFNWLERAFDERSSYLIFLRLQPALHNLRSDPRFFELVRRIGQ